MTLINNARQNLSRLLAPLEYDRFFEDHVSKKPLVLLGDNEYRRANMLGGDPKQVILNAFNQHAAKLTCHAHVPSGPPPVPRAVSGTGDYQKLVSQYHESGYTVRIPDAGNLSFELRKFTRALEILFGNPSNTVVFWSDAGGAAPVHFDNHDIIAIQLHGTKRWFISDAESDLPNDWVKLGEGPPELKSFKTHDVSPGDFIYMPRGTTHTVQSTSESIHLSIGIAPVTVRDIMIATLDHYSDWNKPARENASARADDFSIGEPPVDISEEIQNQFSNLLDMIKDPDFISHAMELRQSRLVADRPPLDPSENIQNLTPESKIRRTDLAIAKLTATPTVLDLSKPGDHLLVHVGAEPALRYILEQDEFQISDIPGEIGDDIRIALTGKLMESGLLELIA